MAGHYVALARAVVEWWETHPEYAALKELRTVDASAMSSLKITLARRLLRHVGVEVYPQHEQDGLSMRTILPECDAILQDSTHAEVLKPLLRKTSVGYLFSAFPRGVQPPT